MKAEKLARILERQSRDRSGVIVSLLNTLAEAAGTRNTPLFQLRLLSRFRPFLRHIVTKKLAQEFVDPTNLLAHENHDPAIYHDAIELACRLGIVVRRGQTVEAISQYQKEGRWVLPQANQQAYDTILAWLDQARSSNPPSNLLRRDTKYLLMQAEYMLELEQLSFQNQVSSKHPDSFYSDLGDLAFAMYTKKVFRRLIDGIKVRNFVDIGCGEGSYLQETLSAHPKASGVGYEINPAVARSATQRFADNPLVEIQMRDFQETREINHYDLALTVFMLFYLTDQERLSALGRINEMLSSGGTLVIAQYFPDGLDVQKGYSYLAVVPWLVKWCCRVWWALCNRIRVWSWVLLR